jgi:hypothetical protein
MVEELEAILTHVRALLGLNPSFQASTKAAHPNTNGGKRADKTRFPPMTEK